MSGLQAIKWLCATYNWDYMFPTHIKLFHEIRTLQHQGRGFRDGHGGALWEPAVSINMKRAYAAWRKKDSGAAGGAVATAEEATTADQGGADDWAADAAAAARVAAQPNGPWSKAVKEAAKRARDRIAARDAAYEACDEEGDIDGNSDDDDGDVDHSAADAVAARAAQLEFHQKNVASLNSGELNLATVPHTRLRPPDAWRQPFTGVGASGV